MFIIENGKMRVINSVEEIDPKDTELIKAFTACQEMFKKEREICGKDKDKIKFWKSRIGKSIMANPQPFIDLLTRIEKDE